MFQKGARVKGRGEVKVESSERERCPVPGVALRDLAGIRMRESLMQIALRSPPEMLAGDVVKRGERRGEPCVVYVETVGQLPGELRDKAAR
jgi:hypothetical protein